MVVIVKQIKKINIDITLYIMTLDMENLLKYTMGHS